MRRHKQLHLLMFGLLELFLLVAKHVIDKKDMRLWFGASEPTDRIDWIGVDVLATYGRGDANRATGGNFDYETYITTDLVNRIDANYRTIADRESRGNTLDSIIIRDGAESNTIGGSNSGDRNIISGNGKTGVAISGSGTDNNQVCGNFIGTNVNGVAALRNRDNGVLINGGAKLNTIGGATDGERNIISGNQDDGVYISGSGTTGQDDGYIPYSSETNENQVCGNYIGTDVSGTIRLPNNYCGVCIQYGAWNDRTVAEFVRIQVCRDRTPELS